MFNIGDIIGWKHLVELLKAALKYIKDNKTRKKLAYLGLALILVPSICLQLISRGTADLTLAEKTMATKEVILFNMPGMLDEDYFVHQKLEVEITPGDYRNFVNFRFSNIQAALNKADGLLKAANARPYAGHLYHLFTSNKKEESGLLTDLMDNYYINVVEKLDLNHNRYTISLAVSKSAGQNIDSAMVYLSKEDPCIDVFLKKKIVEPLQTSSQVVLSFTEFRQAITAGCPHSHTLIKLLSQDCNGNDNCSNLYFSRGAFEINSLSIKMLNSFSKLLLEILPKMNLPGLHIQLEGFADESPLIRAIPVEGGCPVATPGTYLDGKSGRTINSIINNDDLSFARAYSCWKFLLEKLTGTNIRLSYTGRGVTNANANSDENRIVRIIINKDKL